MTQDFRETKIKILSEEHSKAFQKAVLAAGGGWRSSGEFYRGGINFIFLNDSLGMTYCDNAVFFEEHDYKEIQFPQTKVQPTPEDGGEEMNIHELTKQDGFTRQYTHKSNGGVYTVVAVARAADIRSAGFGPIIMYKNESVNCSHEAWKTLRIL